MYRNEKRQMDPQHLIAGCCLLLTEQVLLLSSPPRLPVPRGTATLHVYWAIVSQRGLVYRYGTGDFNPAGQREFLVRPSAG